MSSLDSGSLIVAVPDLSRRGARSSWGGLFLALTGALIATSLVNIGDSGVGFYCAAFALPVFALCMPDRWIGRPWSSNSIGLFAVLGLTAGCLTLDTVLQIVVLSAEPVPEAVHLSTRLSFLFYFAVVYCAVNGQILKGTLIWLRRLLLIVCAYGAYQLPAKMLGLPLFLDWLRNNKSFSMYGYDEGGWIGIVRSTSIFAEPSQSTIPITVLFLLNADRRIAPRHRWLGWVLLLLFTVAGFSRTAWLCLTAAAAAALACKIPGFRTWFPKHKFVVATAILLLLLILPVWGTLAGNYADDLSTQERTQSIALGFQAIKDAPLLGYGWNSFHTVSGYYTSFPVNSYIDFNFIHNMVVSYTQQAGLAGLLLAALPFLIAIGWSTAPVWITFSTTMAFLAAAEFGGDLGYSSLVWLWLALLVKWKTMNELHPRSSQQLTDNSRVFYRPFNEA